jgi:hypothetical protein
VKGFSYIREKATKDFPFISIDAGELTPPQRFLPPQNAKLQDLTPKMTPKELTSLWLMDSIAQLQ